MLPPELIALSTDGNKAVLTLSPNAHAPITEKDVVALLALPEFADLYPLTKTVAMAVSQINALSQTPAGLEKVHFEIAERRDARMQLALTDDNMQASMTLTAAYGGQNLTLKDILQNLKQQKIQQGLLKAKIEQSLQQLALLSPGDSCCHIIAQGRPPIHGKSAYLERKAMLARERLLQPQANQDGSVDMRNLGAIIMVKPGSSLILKHPVVQGVDGYNVLGDTLPANIGKDRVLSAEQGSHLCPSNPNLLIASVLGQPIATPNGMRVDKVLHIENVNVGYGHVNFKGSVLVTGDVGEGMVINSSGDITVLGFVDSATLRAQGDITVSKSVIGRQLKDNQLSSTLNAQGQISAQFVQYSNLEANGNIVITKQLLHSHVKTQQQLTVCDHSASRGDLVGGKIEVGKGLTAVAIGATAGTKTDIFCAININTLKHDATQLAQRIAALEIALSRIDNPPSENLADKKRQITSAIQKKKAELEAIHSAIDDDYKHNHIEALKHVFANVDIHIGNAFSRTQREHGPCRISHCDREIHYDYRSNSHGTSPK
ncbi:FapA family protein [Shewanella sp.]|nr:FapA family protein [Shewanella sp.]